MTLLRTRTRALGAALVPLVILSASDPARAEPPIPARSEVRAPVAFEQEAEPDPCQVLCQVARLQARRNVAALEELADLYERHADPCLRSRILDAIAVIGIRVDRVSKLVYGACSHRDPLVRRSAIAALGRVGDGRDLELLIAALDGSDSRETRAAIGAIGRLSRTRLPASRVRVRSWLSGYVKAGEKAVQDALAELPSALDDEATLHCLRNVVASRGWLDVPSVSQTIRPWLTDPDHRLRAEGLRIVAALRLGAFEKDVRRGVPFVNDTSRPASDLACCALGLDARRTKKTTDCR